MLITPDQSQASSLELASLLLDAFVVAQPWLICGDFNALVGGGTVDTCMCCFGGVPVSVNQPTRWQGNRCVDWMMTNRPRAVSEPRLLSVVLSDHIPVEIDVFHAVHDVKLGRLRPTAMLACPDGVDREFWERAVASAWADDPDVPPLVAYLEKWSAWLGPRRVG